MFLRVERGSSVPVSRQIADQLRALCLVGALKPGQQLPSVRQLARELAVNQNTILRVYERLTAERLVEMRHGEGTFVAQRPSARQLDRQRNKYAGELRRLVRQGLMLGLDGQELHTLLDEALCDAASNKR